MRWLPFILVFLFVYIEISLFIKVAAILGVAVTLLLVIATSCLGASLIRRKGLQNLMAMQHKMAQGESPAVEMIKSVSLLMASFLLIVPGFFTDFLGLLLLLPPIQKQLTLKLLPYFRFLRSANGNGFAAYGGSGNTFEGEFQRKDIDGHIEEKGDGNK